MSEQSITSRCLYCKSRPVNDADGELWCSPQCTQKWWSQQTDQNADYIDEELLVLEDEFVPIETVPARLAEGCVTCARCSSKLPRGTPFLDKDFFTLVGDCWWCNRCVSRYLNGL